MVPRVEHNIPLVKAIAGRMAPGLPRSVEFNDLVHAGVVGLADADQKYDESKGVKFSAYAALRIRGQILDELRGVDWAPRLLRRGIREIEEGVHDCQARLGRDPSIDELSDQIGMPPGLIHMRLREAHEVSLLSLDDVLYLTDSDERPRTVAEYVSSTGPSPLDEVEASDLRQHLGGAVDSLPRQQRLVIVLYYVEQLTLREIGDILELSESRISQVHTRAIASLRRKLRLIYDYPAPAHK